MLYSYSDLFFLEHTTGEGWGLQQINIETYREKRVPGA